MNEIEAAIRKGWDRWDSTWYNDKDVNMLQFIKEEVEEVAIPKKVLAEKLDKFWNERKFVTGNVTSQYEIEEAYRRGWCTCFIKLRELLASEDKNGK